MQFVGNQVSLIYDLPMSEVVLDFLIDLICVKGLCFVRLFF